MATATQEKKAATATAEHVVMVKIGDIVVDPKLQIREDIPSETVQRYAAAWESIEKEAPLHVFDVKDAPNHKGHLTRLLTRGHIRLEARIKLAGGRYADKTKQDEINLIEVPCIVHTGTYAEAVDDAITDNLRHGEPLKLDDRDKAIVAVRDLHPKMSVRDIADKLAVGKSTVDRVLTADRVIRELVPTGTRLRLTEDDRFRAVTVRHLVMIAQAPKEKWAAIVKHVQNKQRNVEQTEKLVKGLNDPKVSDKVKQGWLSGRIPLGQQTPPHKGKAPTTADTKQPSLSAIDQAPVEAPTGRIKIGDGSKSVAGPSAPDYTAPEGATEPEEPNGSAPAESPVTDGYWSVFTYGKLDTLEVDSDGEDVGTHLTPTQLEAVLDVLKDFDQENQRKGLFKGVTQPDTK